MTLQNPPELRIADDLRERVQRFETGRNDESDTYYRAATDRTVLVGQLDRLATLLRHPLMAAARPRQDELGLEEWAANGLAALDHLDRLYYAGEPGGVAVGDYRAATDAIRAALRAAPPSEQERLRFARPIGDEDLTKPHSHFYELELPRQDEPGLRLRTLRGRVLQRLDRYWLDGKGTKEDAISDIFVLFDAALAALPAATEPADGQRTLDELRGALAEALDTHPDEVVDEARRLVRALTAHGLRLCAQVHAGTTP